MTPEAAAGSFIFSALRNRGALTALLANVDEWGAAVFPEKIPEGDDNLPAVVFVQSDGRDVAPMGERQVVGVPFTVMVCAAGEALPHNIAAEVDEALDDVKGVVGGYAITVSRIGAGRPSSGMVGKREYRTIPQRYLVGLSPSL